MIDGMEDGKHWSHRIRDGVAWFSCICFFLMTPLEFASLHWSWTRAGEWLVTQSDVPASWVAGIASMWSLLVMGGTAFFLLMGVGQRFSQEKRWRSQNIGALDFAYYVTWVQTLMFLFSLVNYVPLLSNTKGYEVISPYLLQLAMLLAAWLMFHNNGEALGLSRLRTNLWWKAIVSVGIVYIGVYLYLDSWVTEPIAHLFSLDLNSWREESISRELQQAGGIGTWLLNLLMIGIIGPIAEEVFFRGVLQSVLMRWLGVWGGVLGSAFLFAFFHIDVVLFAPLFILGIILALFRVRFASLWVPILFHILNNSMSVILEWWNGT